MPLTITTGDELTVRTANSLRATLLAQLTEGASLVLDAAEIRAIDLCGLQLLCSAHHTARARNAILEIANLPESVRATARDTGFDPQSCDAPCREGTCIWRT